MCPVPTMSTVSPGVTASSADAAHGSRTNRGSPLAATSRRKGGIAGSSLPVAMTTASAASDPPPARVTPIGRRPAPAGPAASIAVTRDRTCSNATDDPARASSSSVPR